MAQGERPLELIRHTLFSLFHLDPLRLFDSSFLSSKRFRGLQKDPVPTPSRLASTGI